MQGNLLKTGVRAITCFLILLLMSGCRQGGIDPAKTEPAHQLTSLELFSQYSDLAAGDEKFKSKIIQVKGTVVRTGRNVAGNILVFLRGSENRGDIQCAFEKEYAAKASEMQEGQELTVRGKCKGRLINVILDQCVIVQ